MKNIDFQFNTEKNVPSTSQFNFLIIVEVEQEAVTHIHRVDSSKVEKILKEICNSLIQSADLLTDLDRQVRFVIYVTRRWEMGIWEKILR